MSTSNDEDLNAIGKATLGRSPMENLWITMEKNGKKLPGNFTGPARDLRLDEACKGEAWFVIGWQDREKKLFALSGEVAAKLNLQR